MAIPIFVCFSWGFYLLFRFAVTTEPGSFPPFIPPLFLAFAIFITLFCAVFSLGSYLYYRAKPIIRARITPRSRRGTILTPALAVGFGECVQVVVIRGFYQSTGNHKEIGLLTQIAVCLHDNGNDRWISLITATSGRHALTEFAQHISQFTSCSCDRVRSATRLDLENLVWVDRPLTNLTSESRKWQRWDPDNVSAEG